MCNNAGGGGDPWVGPLEGSEWTIGVNLWGVVYGVRAFLPHIVSSGGGHIVNTASIAGLLPGFSPAHDASKHAVVALTEGLYLNLAGEIGRFWVFPHADFLDIAVERFHRVADGIDSQQVELPGMPPRSEMLAEAMAAMMTEADTN